MTDKATFFIADRRINEFMKLLDLRDDFKWYVDIREVNFSNDKEINRGYLYKIINQSHDNFNNWGCFPKEFWIPCIKYQSKTYVHYSVKQISDGQGNIIFN